MKTKWNLVSYLEILRKIAWKNRIYDYSRLWTLINAMYKYQIINNKTVLI